MRQWGKRGSEGRKANIGFVNVLGQLWATGSIPLGPSEEPCRRCLGINPLEGRELGHLSTDSHPHWLKVAPVHMHAHTLTQGCTGIYPSKLARRLRKRERERGRGR